MVFLTPRLDGLEQADAGLKVGEQAFLRTDLPLGFLETNPSARVAAILAPAPPCQREPSIDRKSAGRFQRHCSLSQEESLWLEPLGRRTIKWVLIAA